MAIQAIPTTDSMEVAELAAAIRLLECSSEYSADQKLDERLAMFVRAYEGVKAATQGGAGGTAGSARAVREYT